jgi:4-amino-4-deoxy-L-arabinose transferase-like glycosyltransferase
MTVEDIAPPRPLTAMPEARAAPHDRVRVIAIEVVLCVALFALAMVPRAAWIVYNDRPPQGLNDPVLYNYFGDIMADGGGYTRPVSEECPADDPCPFAYYPVGFPATLAGLKKAGDLIGQRPDILALKMMNGVFGAATVVMLYLLASRLIDRRAGLVSAGLLAIFPSQIFYTGTILSEPLFTMLLVASVLALAWRPWSRDGMPYPQLAIAGLLLSAATMTRGITLIFPLLLLVIWLFYLHSKQRALLQTLVLFAGIAVLVLPWTARNIVQFQTIVGPSTNVGDDLCIGNYADADGKFVLSGKCFVGFEGFKPDKLEIERNREGLEIAVKDRLADPIGTIPLVMKKAYWLLYKDDDGLWAAESYGNDWFISHPRREILSFAANAIYYATGVLVLFGMAAFALSKDLRRLFVLLTMLYILAVPLAFFGDPRFHYPAIPFAIAIAGTTIVWLWDRRRLFENAPA